MGLNQPPVTWERVHIFSCFFAFCSLSKVVSSGECHFCELNRQLSLSQNSFTRPAITQISHNVAPTVPPLRHTLAPPDTPRLHPLTPYRYHWKASVDQAHSVCDELGYSVKQLIVGSLFTVVIEPWRQYISLHAYIDITRLRSTASHISDLSRPPHILLSTFLFAYLRISALANTFRWIARLTHLCVNV